ncbi:MAG: glycosyltransferase [Candidatus Sulfotelmatobacter sp.]
MLTVLMATRNRAATLQQTLESFCRLQEPSSGWKLVIVDNGSTDQTPAVLASFENRLPLHTVYEPTNGKNSALNTGLDIVEGDLTVFTDDDVFPHADWLVELRNAADAQLAYSMFGGAVVPRWEIPPPHWVQWVQQGPVYSLADLSLKEGPLSPFLVFGPNMAIRTSVFQSGTRFDSATGPSASHNYAMGSETELTLRLDREGHKAWFVPSAVVEHFIRDYQIRKAWVLKRAIRYGRGMFRLHNRTDNSEIARSWFEMPIPLRLYVKLFKEAIKIAKARVRSDERGLFSAHWRLNYLWGYVIEARLSRLRRIRVI